MEGVFLVDDMQTLAHEFQVGIDFGNDGVIAMNVVPLNVAGASFSFLAFDTRFANRAGRVVVDLHRLLGREWVVERKGKIAALDRRTRMALVRRRCCSKSPSFVFDIRRFASVRLFGSTVIGTGPRSVSAHNGAWFVYALGVIEIEVLPKPLGESGF